MAPEELDGFSLKEMFITLLSKVDNIERKLDDIKDSKADKDEVRAQDARIRELERKVDREDGVADYKKWVVPTVVSTVVSIVSVFIYIWAYGKL